MYKKYPSLKDILDDLDSIDKDIKWAAENELSDHTLVRKRINQCTIKDIKDISIKDIVNEFSDPDILTEWGIDNLLLHHRFVLNRLVVLLTCYRCHTKFDSSIGLKEHICLTQTQQCGSLTCSWCGLKCCSHTELTKHEEFQVLMENLCTNSHNELVTTNQTTGDNQSPNNKHVICMQETNQMSKEITIEDNIKPNIVQYGSGSGNDVLPYTFQQTGQKTFAKNLAQETTYRIKFKIGWKDHKIKNLIKEINDMFEKVIERVKGKEGGDLDRIIINHPEFNHAILVPLDKWSNINANRVMEAIERFLNSDENLPLDDQMSIIVGNISIPKGSGKQCQSQDCQGLTVR